MSSDATVSVIADGPEAIEALTLLLPETAKVEAKSGFDSIGAGEIVLIDRDWYQKQEKERADNFVRELVLKGCVMLSIGSPGIFIMNERLNFTAFSNDAEVYGVGFSPAENRRTCLSIGCDDVKASLNAALLWASDMLSLQGESLQQAGSHVAASIKPTHRATTLGTGGCTW